MKNLHSVIMKSQNVLSNQKWPISPTTRVGNCVWDEACNVTMTGLCWLVFLSVIYSLACSVMCIRLLPHQVNGYLSSSFLAHSKPHTPHKLEPTSGKRSFWSDFIVANIFTLTVLKSNHFPQQKIKIKIDNWIAFHIVVFSRHWEQFITCFTFNTLLLLFLHFICKYTG